MHIQIILLDLQVNISSLQPNIQNLKEGLLRDKGCSLFRIQTLFFMSKIMDRVIKFRAKTITTDIWVESMTISKGHIKRKQDNLYFELSENNWVGVNPKSLGQFTGFNDDENTDIYEGDILYCHKTAFNYFVCFHNGSFSLVPILTNGVKGERIILTLEQVAYKNVRGNTFDQNVFEL